MKNVLTIIKKEFHRFFCDKRMLINVLLPGLVIYLMYSLMGAAIEGMQNTVPDDYKPTLYVQTLPEELSYLNFAFDITTEGSLDEAKTLVESGDLDAAAEFPEDFGQILAGGLNPENTPQVKIYYNSSIDTSLAGFTVLNAVLGELNSTKFVVNQTGTDTFDLVSEQDIVVTMMSILVPTLMFSLLASACVAVAPESFAGEKERGTMATMLITPIKRWQLALGKIISLTFIAILSGLSSFIGVILSLPKIMGGIIDGSAALMYGAGDYFALFGLIISIQLVIISVFSVLSTLAKNVKEAGMIISPAMIVVIVLGLSSAFISGNPALGMFAIPFMGSGLALSSVMSFTATAGGLALAIGSNLLVAAAMVVLLGFMFKSERIMFNK